MITKVLLVANTIFDMILQANPQHALRNYFLGKVQGGSFSLDWFPMYWLGLKIQHITSAKFFVFQRDDLMGTVHPMAAYTIL